MQEVRVRSFILLGGTTVALSLIALLVNHLKFQFIGNNYFPDGTFYIALILIINYFGLIMFFGKKNRITNSGLELINFYLIMCIIAFATNSVQLTPFKPIDWKIIELENSFGINLIAMMKWLCERPIFKLILSIIYDSLPYQMSILPLCVIISGRVTVLRDYYMLMLITTLIGFIIYYFFPTTAPASMLDSTLFLPEQIDTGLKFFQIHHHQIPTTNEGGLIAMPSFHTIWAILCVYLIKDWRVPCILLALINLLLIISCVLLGWHYPSDILAGIILLIIAYYCLKWIKT